MHLQIILYKKKGPLDEGDGIVDLLIGNTFGSIGPISNLVDIIPDGRQLPEKGSIFIGWTGPKLDIHYQLSDRWLYL